MMSNRATWDEKDLADLQARTEPQAPSRGDLHIDSETVMAAIPRGDEELRVMFTRATTGAGKQVAWHSIRVFWKAADGAWHPGKQGISIRGKELAAVAAAFAKAVGGAARSEPKRELLPDEEYRRRRGEVSR